MIPFAALTIERILVWTWARQWWKPGLTVVGVAILCSWTARPLPLGMELVRRADYTAPGTFYYLPEAALASQRGDWRRSADLLGELLRFAPPGVLQLEGDAAAPQPRKDELLVVAWVGKVHMLRAESLKKLGELAAAAEQERRGLKLLRAAQENK